METVSVNQFRDKLKTYVEQVVSNHTLIKVTRRAGEAFVMVSADDWEREQETLHVLQNKSLMQQIADSLATHMPPTTSGDSLTLHAQAAHKLRLR